MPDSIRILGVRVDNVTYQETLARVNGYLREGSFHHLATLNTEFIVMAQENAEFRRVLETTSLNVPDGVGVTWAARWIGQPLRERVTGQELVDQISALAADRGYRLFLLGAGEGVAECAAEELARRYPNLQVAGCYPGCPDIEEQEEIVKRVNASGSQILFVAYGPPKQELWIARNAARLRVVLAMGVGGTFDTLAGVVPRAPEVMRRVGFEWLYRLWREPRRLRRQLAIPYFMWLMLTRGRQDPKR